MGFVNQTGWKVGLEVIPESDNLKLSELCHLEEWRIRYHKMRIDISVQYSNTFTSWSYSSVVRSVPASSSWQVMMTETPETFLLLISAATQLSPLSDKTDLTLLEVHTVGFHVGQSLILKSSDW